MFTLLERKWFSLLNGHLGKQIKMWSKRDLIKLGELQNSPPVSIYSFIQLYEKLFVKNFMLD